MRRIFVCLVSAMLLCSGVAFAASAESADNTTILSSTKLDGTGFEQYFESAGLLNRLDQPVIPRLDMVGTSGFSIEASPFKDQVITVPQVPEMQGNDRGVLEFYIMMLTAQRDELRAVKEQFAQMTFEELRAQLVDPLAQTVELYGPWADRFGSVIDDEAQLRTATVDYSLEPFRGRITTAEAEIAAVQDDADLTDQRRQLLAAMLNHRGQYLREAYAQSGSEDEQAALEEEYNTVVALYRQLTSGEVLYDEELESLEEVLTNLVGQLQNELETARTDLEAQIAGIPYADLRAEIESFIAEVQAAVEQYELLSAMDRDALIQFVTEQIDAAIAEIEAQIEQLKAQLEALDGAESEAPSSSS